MRVLTVLICSLLLASCSTTMLCTADMKVPPAEYPDRPATMVTNKEGLVWLEGKLDPAFDLNYAQIKRINDSCKKDK